MNPLVKDILIKINTAGYKSYVVGGYVRDYIMCFDNNFDIDITTDAPKEILLSLFKEYSPKVYKYDTINFKIDNYSIDIAHFRDEKLVDNDLVVNMSFDIKTDSLRRDFTINSIYMDANEKFVDLYNGIDDLKRKRIVFIGDPSLRIKEDPDRILRMIYLSIKYGFTIDEKICKDIFDISMDYISLCSTSSLKKYLLKILDTGNYEAFFEITRFLGVSSYFFDTIDNVLCDNLFVFLISSKFKYMSILPNDINKSINNINEIIKISNIDEKTLFKYSYEENISAAIMLDIPLATIKNIYNSMQIHIEKDIKINKKEIADMLNSLIDEKVNKIYNNIVDLLIYNRISNDKDVLKEYVLRGD